MKRPVRIIAALVILSFPVVPAWAVEGDLTIADLAAYRAALDRKPPEKAVDVTFRELWNHPKTYEGKEVRVGGRVERIFRQGPFETYPALAEVWIVSRVGDPICVVFPGADTPRPGDSVRFVGTYLKMVRYQGGDGARLAPLIVGSRPPLSIALKTPPPVASDSESFTVLDWVVGLAAAAFATAVIAWQHLRRPVSRSLESQIDPPPVFESEVGGADCRDQENETRIARSHGEHWLSPPPCPPPQGGRVMDLQFRQEDKTPSPLVGEGWGGGSPGTNERVGNSPESGEERVER